MEGNISGSGTLRAINSSGTSDIASTDFYGLCLGGDNTYSGGTIITDGCAVHLLSSDGLGSSNAW